jgi:hypothetical protein
LVLPPIGGSAGTYGCWLQPAANGCSGLLFLGYWMAAHYRISNGLLLVAFHFSFGSYMCRPELILDCNTLYTLKLSNKESRVRRLMQMLGLSAPILKKKRLCASF